MPKLGSVTPILRIFGIAKAREFYLGFLGFEVQWEHRFDDNAPLYMAVARDGSTSASTTATARLAPPCV